MTVKEALEIIDGGENNFTEFKKKFSTYEKIAKEIIAFANTRGGNIFFGIEDNGEICGVESEKETVNLLKETANYYCEPSVTINIEILELKGKDVVVGIIPESESKPHRIQDGKKIINFNTAKVFLRMRSKSVQASPEMIKFLHTSYGDFDELTFTMSDREKALFSYLEKNEKITTKEFSKLVNIAERRAQRILVKLVRLGVINIYQEENGKLYFIAK